MGCTQRTRSGALKASPGSTLLAGNSLPKGYTMRQDTIDKMRASSYLLPDPGGEVVRECLAEIERMKHVFRSIPKQAGNVGVVSDELPDAKYGATQSPEDALREKTAGDLVVAEWAAPCQVKDENGISINMLDHAVAILAEGLGAGQTDVRHLLYCVIRDALAS